MGSRFASFFLLIALSSCLGCPTSPAGTDAKPGVEPVPSPETPPAVTPSAPASTAAPSPTPHRDRTLARNLPAACKDLTVSPPTEPPTALFDAGDPRVQGTDVSVAQGLVPWQALHRGGVEFVYVRASEGVATKDSHFARNWEMARACAIPRGAYHVYEPTQDPDEQVAEFLGMLGQDQGELPAAIDIEITREMVEHRNKRHKTRDKFPTPDEYLKGVARWVTKVEEKTGRKPLVYIQPWYWHSYLAKSGALTEHPLWAAGSAPRAADGWAWALWQHGEPVHWNKQIWDRNRFRSGPQEFASFLGAGPSAALK